ncbi:MAG: restriction endonuclease subunit S [Planctomycetia bacterium]|nr:restriction endonuclease subunit S [Planctomycetia bacterium]
MTLTIDYSPIKPNVVDIDTWSPQYAVPEDEFDYIDIASVDRDTKTIIGTSRISASEAPSRARQIVKSNDVLVSTVRPNLNAVALVPEHLTDAIASTGFCVLRCHPNKLDYRYLFHWVRTELFVADMVRQATGASYPAVSDRIIKESRFPLPPLPEQKRIADILDKADEIRRKRREAVQSLEALSDSLFRQFSDGAETQARTIAELLESHVLLVHKDGNYGGSYPRKHEFGSVGIPFLSAKHVAADGTLVLDDVPRLNEEKARTLTFGWIEQGDVLLAHNATVGPVALYRGDFPEALIGTSLTCFRPNPKLLTSEFLFAALRGSHFQQQLEKEMSQTTRNQVPITAQRRLTLYVPELKEQAAFANQLSGTHRLREKYSGSACESESLFNSLVQRAFRGGV